MIELLKRDVVLVIISGTTYEKIAFGELHSQIPPTLLDNLYLGLGRGAFNFGFTNGEIKLLQDTVPEKPTLVKLHKVAFQFHLRMLEKYDLETDIVFSRPNYCKIDLLVEHDRSNRYHMEHQEVQAAIELLKAKGYRAGLAGLLDEASELGCQMEMPVSATTDGKFLEVGLTTKADNVNFIFEHIVLARKISLSECAFWGDEFGLLAERVHGSDAHMITHLTKDADFFDVSDSPLELPSGVKAVPGGIRAFHEFLKQQIQYGCN
jgi:hypothetical protein